MHWRTRIERWEPGKGFIDVQERGPFSRWEHEHRFEVFGNRVHMIDRVRYELPLGRVGRLMGGVRVRAALDAIFDYRYHTIAAIWRYGGSDTAAAGAQRANLAG